MSDERFNFDTPSEENYSETPAGSQEQDLQQEKVAETGYYDSGRYYSYNNTGTHDAEYGTHDTEYGTRDTEYGTYKSASSVSEPPRKDKRKKKQQNDPETKRQTVAVSGGYQIAVIFEGFPPDFFSFFVCIHTSSFRHKHTDILYHIWYSVLKTDTVFRKKQIYKKCHRTVAGSVALRYLHHVLIVGFAPYGSSKILHFRLSVAQLDYIFD
jgi:hypothetical protein